ncbi:hypothetical protein Goshw_000208, partial [Gossypium schwendimanii]|nr:hypothetical protein [Gossypium schwendimanii]
MNMLPRMMRKSPKKYIF